MDELLRPIKTRATELDAWPVISSLLFELAQASDDIVSIIGRAGLIADWTLNPKDAYSHSTRKRAYQPRVNSAYSALGPEDRNTVLSLITAEMARRYPTHVDAMKIALSRVGWTLKAVAAAEDRVGETPSPMKRNKDLQRLLLLQVRDGKEPPELAQYSEQEQVYNSALLIKDHYVDGEAITNGDGVYVSTVMIQLTSKGHDFLEEPAMTSTFSPSIPTNSTRKKIFISHSSADEDLAEALVELLCTALTLRRSDFLCTSVDGDRVHFSDPLGALVQTLV